MSRTEQEQVLLLVAVRTDKDALARQIQAALEVAAPVGLRAAPAVFVKPVHELDVEDRVALEHLFGASTVKEMGLR